MKRRVSVLAMAGVATGLVLALAGCAAPPRDLARPGPHWSGRLALQVEGPPGQSFTAGFDLRGSAGQGELELFTPLGASAAMLQWAPGQASLRTLGQPPRTAASLDDLVTQATGTSIPLAALFDWLVGVPTAAAGWQADLSQHAAGRLRARRLTTPAADLRIILEAP